MKLPEDVSLIVPNAEDFQRLLPVARHIFTATFAHDYDKSEFEAFCDKVYWLGGSMSRDFDAADVHWQVATVAGAPIGYAKLTPLRAPAADALPNSLELQQIYVLPYWHGTGVADRLIRWGIATALQLEAPEIYLTVFDHNERAKRFYARHGFEEVGRCTFQLGDRIDDDRIWRRSLHNLPSTDQLLCRQR